MLTQEALRITEHILNKFPHSRNEDLNIPLELDYLNCMLIRNFMLLALFRYTHPNEIKLNYRELIETGLILNHFICPCGDTV